ncbi:MAG: hypothetical protein M1817_002962 [Caeruleum heppii]|nr:MAG: hypothetical protein M1817_002962 [Caeruleum heppii]
MFHFGAGPHHASSFNPASENSSTQFSFRANRDAPEPRFPSRAPSDRYRPAQDSRGRRGGARGRQQRRHDAGQRRPFWNQASTHDRPLLRARRSTTPEQLTGMTEEATTNRRFVSMDDVSDSDEQDMEVESRSDEDVTSDWHSHKQLSVAGDDDFGEEPPRKRQALDGVLDGSKSANSIPKWSNPDPYTVLPPPDESLRKKKDIVKLIRKARVTTEQLQQSKDAVAKNADFIALDTEDGPQASEHERARAEDSQAFESRQTNPTAFSHRVVIQGEYMGNDSTSTGRNGDTAGAGSFSRPVDTDFPDTWPPLTTNAALGNRKRTHDDVLKEDLQEPHPVRPKRKRRSIHSYVLDEWRPRSDSDPTPWATLDHDDTSNPSLRLHKEICDFYAYVKPEHVDHAVRSELLQRLQRQICVGPFQDSDIHCFGSFAAGLYLPDADMDLVLVSRSYMQNGVPKHGVASRGKRKNIVFYQQFAASLKYQRIPEANRVLVITGAKVPLVKFVDRLTGLKVDLSFENDTGIIANRTFQLWKTQYPAMPIIVMVIKQFLAMRGLNDVSTGGLGGFSVTCLVTSLLQMMPEVQSGNMLPEQHLGDILLQFFDLYGNRFNKSQTGIQLEPPGYFEKSRNPLNIPYRMNNGHRLSISDPNRPQNDISGGTSEIDAIFDLFSEAHEMLKQSMHESSNAATRDELHARTLLEPLLGGDYYSFDEQRQHLHQLYYHPQEGWR